MKLADTAAPVERLWSCDPLTDLEGIAVGDEVKVSTEDSLITITGATLTVTARPTSTADLDAARATADAGRRALVEVVDIGLPMTLRTLEFASRTRSVATRHIAVDDDALALLPAPLRGPSLDATCMRLRAVWVVDRTPDAIIVSVGADAAPTDGSAAMRLVGSGFAMDVKPVDDIMRITRVVSSPRWGDTALHLIEGEIEFVPATYAVKVDEVASAEVARLYESTSAYFNVWQRYSEIELSLAEDAARAVGVAPYESVRPNLDGSFTFFLASGPESDLVLENLADRELDLSASANPEPSRVDRTQGQVHGRARYDPHLGERAVTLEPLAEPRSRLPDSGYLYGSRVGDAVRHERRLKAMQLEEMTPRKSVRQLLEGVAPPVPERRRRIQPISDAVLDAFGGRPTEAQVRALDVALNTPDIALIQGPPGTGKTRVIAALQARLAEEAAKGPAVASRILLTSEQHDAVQNAIAASVDGRLPPIKLGRRVGHADEEHLTEWAHALRARLEERQAARPQPRMLGIWFELQDRVLAFEAGATTPQATLELLQWLREEAAELLDPPLRGELDEAIQHARRAARLAFPASEADRIERRARALRTEGGTFADDGRITCRAARDLLSSVDAVRPADLALLDRLVDADAPSPAHLRLLRDVQERLIDQCVLTRRSSSNVKADSELVALVARCRVTATAAIEKHVSPIDLAVARFSRRLRDEPVAVRNSILRHTSSLAATCQQTLGTELQTVQLSEAPFETVIIDEAARANPLDLLIPMSLGRTRVIFVGDHRQLPQMLEPAVRRAMASERPDEALDEVLEQSFFERLFTRLADGTHAVTRTVTLDQQFRMHPVLGAFISEQFYAPHGERFDNGPGTDERRVDGLPLTGPAVWVDAPSTDGPEERTAGRHGSSFRRTAEARKAVALLNEIIDTTESRTAGVITFYTGQEIAIWQELERQGKAMRTDRGYQLSPTWTRAHTDSMLPRVRIGTVDSFQGREFDVSILSLVRSNDRPPTQPSQRYRKYGFLTYPNRLCVAMSRQRDALVIVGDREMFGTSDALAAVPALHAFQQLAETAHE